jgi:Bacterial regulatory proteins, lacI family
MASILEIARLANVSADNVLRVVNGEPVSSNVASKVASAIEAVGPPPSPRSRAEIAATEKRTGSEASELVSRVDQMAAELETRLPQDVSSIVYEALRVEVQPVSRHMAELDALYKLISARLEDMRLAIDRERNERLGDVALLTELVSEGWRSADRRLARLESMLARLEDAIGHDRNPLQFHFPSSTDGLDE